MLTTGSYRLKSDYELPPIEKEPPLGLTWDTMHGVTPELRDYLRSIEEGPIDFLITSTMEPIGNYFRFSRYKRKNRRK